MWQSCHWCPTLIHKLKRISELHLFQTSAILIVICSAELQVCYIFCLVTQHNNYFHHLLTIYSSFACKNIFPNTIRHMWYVQYYQVTRTGIRLFCELLCLQMIRANKIWIKLILDFSHITIANLFHNAFIINRSTTLKIQILPFLSFPHKHLYLI